LERIQILPDSVQKKIAAGEVVEGPFSVVKELIENSIDAGATRIDVQVEEGGLKRIVVRDDGSGIHPDDMALAVAEHATSKISEIGDMERIGSYGFRGEALSSISAVSRLTILSRKTGEDMGARLSGEGNGFQVAAYAGEAGTTVIVENLFYNIPARKKFLKSARAELRAVRETLLRSAIPHPDIAFSLAADEGRPIALGRSEGIGRRLAQIYGEGVTDDLCFVRLQDLKVEVGGFLSRPHFLKSSRSMQILYVNGRPVEYRRLGFLLGKAYEAVAAKGRYPAGIIFVDLDPALVDVNIHPAKREVKLFDVHYIDRLIMSLGGKALNRDHEIREGLFVPLEEAEETGRIEHEAAGPQHRRVGSSPSPEYENRSHRSPAHGRDMPPPPLVRELADLYHDFEAGKGGSILGVAFGAYIFLERDDSVFIIDFHAAHERIVYDSLVRGKEESASQALVFPEILELSVQDHALVLENIEKFSEIGFDIDDFSDTSITIRAVPGAVREADISGIFGDFFASLGDGRDPGGITDKIAAAAACRAAKRAGDRLTDGDIDAIVDAVFRDGVVRRCPHGRPFVYRLNRQDIERMFKRS
jgi:DNA mismatch repair protein MutL